jgi:hypothetical protein
MWPDHRRLYSQERVSALKGIDEDVKSIFFDLDVFTLTSVFNEYQRQFGRSSRKYAQKTFEKWKSGAVEMSGDIAIRLVSIVPLFLNFEQKYKLIAKLWRNYCSASRLRMSVASEEQIEAAVATVFSSLNKGKSRSIPEAVRDKLTWLACDDAKNAELLLQQVIWKEAEITSVVLRKELKQLLRITSLQGGNCVQCLRTIQLPFALLEVTLVPGDFDSQKDTQMAEEKNEFPTPPQSDGSIVPAPSSQNDARSVPIQNPNDLIGEGLKQLPPHKAEELRSKAADEALRLQALQKEQDIHLEVAKKKLEQLSEQAQELSRQQVEFQAETEHKTEDGKTSLRIQSPQAAGPAPKREVKGSCFIATACYGDYDHPTVAILRSFRDQILKRRPFGRNLVGLYYRIGPFCAAIVNQVPILKSPMRLALACFARIVEHVIASPKSPEG